MGNFFGKATSLTALAFALATAAVVGAQGWIDGIPVHHVDGSFVREWLVLGPFPGKGLETDYLAASGGEGNIHPKEGDSITRSDGTRLIWTRLKAPSDNVSLEAVMGIQQWAVAYAYCELESDQESDSQLRAANEGNGVSVRLNGNPIGKLPPHVDRNLDIHAVLPMHLNAGRNSCLMKIGVAQREWTFVAQPLPSGSATVELGLADAAGKVVSDAQVELYENGRVVNRLKTDTKGKAEVCLFPIARKYDVRVVSGSRGSWVLDLSVQSGEHRLLKPALSEAISISGRVSALDGSPQAAIVVQALFENAGSVQMPANTTNLPPFSETVLSDTNGFFSFVNLHPGKYRLRCHGADKFVYLGSEQKPAAVTSDLISVPPGQSSEKVTFVLPEVKKGVWKSYPITQGLIEVEPRTVQRAADGMLWIGTSRSSLFSFDGFELKMEGGAPEIPGIDVLSVQPAADGTIWIGSSGGISHQISGRTQLFPFGDKLPRVTVNDIHVDSDGTVWFATASGLSRYDKRGFTTFSVADGLPSNVIVAVLRARDGLLYLLTESGLVQFDGQKFDLVQPFDRLAPRNVGSGANDGRYSWLWTQPLYEARDGALWFGTQFDGAYRFDGKKLTKFGTENGLLSDYITSIAQTSDNALWFGTPDGLSRFDGITVKNYVEADGLAAGFVTDLHVDSDDVIWCATKKGISRFDPNSFLRFTKLDGMRNREGRTAGVLAIETDPAGGAWIGTEWGGLFKVNGDEIQPATTGTERQYVRRIYRADDGEIWLGMPKGIFRYENGKLRQILERSWVIALEGDNAGNLWYGQGWNGGGLSRFNLKTREEKIFTKADGLPDDSVWSIERGSGDELWIGTSEGLARFNHGKIEDLRGKMGIPSGGVFNLRRGTNETIWIGSSQGLHRFETVSNASSDPGGTQADLGSVLPGFKRISITATNGLPDPLIWCSARTPDGIIWMGSDHNGLIGYDGKAMTVIDKRDGLLGNQVLALGSSTDGSLWVGTLDAGLNRFKPSPEKPSVRLREVKLDDQTLTDFSRVSRMETGHRVTIQYQEIDHKTHPDKRQFSYRLSKPSGETVFAGITKERRFEWTPRKAGAYSFEVQAVDRDLKYSAPAKLTFRVSVPWFANAWILAPTGTAIGGLIAWAFIARGLYVGKQREAARLQERLLKQESQAREALERKSCQLEEAKEAAEKAKEAAEAANLAKSTFLATMSHEIRTPLNAILGFSDLLNRVVKDPKERSHLSAISSSGRGLLTIINDILDLSKIEAGRLELHYEPVSIRRLLSEVAQVFSQKVEEKGLKVEIEVASDLPESLLSDEVRLRQILFNVVGNAVKFTDRGSITLSAACKFLDLQKGKVDLLLSVSDSGIGIPAGELDRIFETFTQVGGQNSRKYGGTGLGLAITKRLTEILNGTLRVESEAGKGSIFYFEFPGVKIADASGVVPVGEEVGLDLRQLKPSTILIVEDHSLNRSLLAAYFEGTGHRLIMATNGREAVELTRDQTPDLILMDIRMPEMDGWEASRIFKSDPRFKSVPIVIITASILADEASEHLGLHDAFLRKPVSRAELARVLASFLPRIEREETVRPGIGEEAGPAAASGKAVRVSPELLALLDQESTEVWERLCDRPNIAQIKKFAVRLEKWGSDYEALELLRFAQKLHRQADQFDLEGLFQTLRRFPRICEELAANQ
jgi:signal transduction histidine kinase/ligand-binding sensor domain-containing protein/DNA-binding response OmpR family regulator